MGDHVQPEDLADNPVGQDALDAVTRLDPHPPLLQGQQDQDPLVLALLPDAPGLVETGGVIVDHHVPHVRHRRHDNGRARLLQNLPGEIFHDGPLIRRDYVGKIIDGACRAGEGRVRCSANPCLEGEHEDQKKGCRQTSHHRNRSVLFVRGCPCPLSSDRIIGSGS